jgi:hypothetical protein
VVTRILAIVIERHVLKVMLSITTASILVTTDHPGQEGTQNFRTMYLRNERMSSSIDCYCAQYNFFGEYAERTVTGTNFSSPCTVSPVAQI